MKFALISTVAAASANQMYLGIPPVGMTFAEPVEPVFEVEALIKNSRIEEVCPDYDRSGDLEDFAMIRKIYYTIWNSSVRGFYRSARKNPVSEECVGDWMDTLKVDIETVINLLDQGKFGEITADKLKAITNGLIDVFYKNWEVCGVQETIQDGFEWCTEDIGTCLYQENFMNRMIEKATPLLSRSFDLFNLINQENVCLNDTESLALVGRVIYDLTSVVGSIVGFERKFVSQKAEYMKSLDTLGNDLDAAQDAYDLKHANDEPRPNVFADTFADSFDINDFKGNMMLW